MPLPPPTPVSKNAPKIEYANQRYTSIWSVYASQAFSVIASYSCLLLIYVCFETVLEKWHKLYVWCFYSCCFSLPMRVLLFPEPREEDQASGAQTARGHWRAEDVTRGTLITPGCWRRWWPICFRWEWHSGWFDPHNAYTGLGWAIWRYFQCNSWNVSTVRDSAIPFPSWEMILRDLVNPALTD